MWMRGLRGATLAMMIAVTAMIAACGSAQTVPSSASHETSATIPANGGSTPSAGAETTPPASAPSPASETKPPATESAAAQESAKPTPTAPSTSPSGSPSASPSPSSAKPAEASPPSPEAAKTVTFSIVGNAEWGTVLKPEEVALRKNDTVADLLIRTLKAHKLAYDTSGSGAMFYVAGIDGLFEFDDGPTSGWKFKVNGKVSDVGAGAYEPKPGDRVEWFYTSQDKDAEEDGKEQAP